MVSYSALLLLVAVLGSALASLSSIEQQYFAIPNRNNTRDYLYNYTSIPHLAGTLGDWETVEYTRDKFLEFGFQVNVTTHNVYMNYPLHRVVQLIAPNGTVVFSANMTEPVVPVDPTSSNPNSVATYNGYGASGNVTAPLVYANYGTLEDFEYLQSINVSVNGTIVLVRYGLIFRGVKAYLAQKYGAIGLLIYSDPIDDGYVRGPVYPVGPYRPEFGVQRGSVQFLNICPGSPSQERVAVCLGEENAEEPFSGSLIPNIPVQPLSWGDALPLLLSLVGTHNGSQNFYGGLNITYCTGPSTFHVNLGLVMNYTTTPIWNVIATMPGVNHDEVVLMGNHRDAWVFGACDPNSGSSSMLEAARALSVLRNTTGWVPQRDIVFCSWDGEELGLLGSTAWGEENAEFLQSKAIVYVNLDVGVSGSRFSAGGTPSLYSLIQQLSMDLPYPGAPNTTLWQNWGANQLDILGSGSDYTVFLANLGIPSLDFGYDGPMGGVYHSIYDSFYWMEQFGDPEFIFHEGMARLLGVLLMRLADTGVHPFNYTNYGNQLSVYLSNIQNKTTLPANYSNLQAAVSQFTQAGVAIDSQALCASSNSCVSAVDVASLNIRLRQTERRLLLNALTNESVGLPLRPWFKHVVQAPGLYLGYGSQTFPGIMQGIIDNSSPEIQAQIDKAAVTIANAAQALTLLSVNVTSITPNKCYGDSLGALNLTSQGGFSPVTFYTANATWQSSPILTNLPAGTYTIFVRDSMNITSSINVTIPQPPKLELSVRKNGKKASLDVSGGVGNYTIVWSTGVNSSNSIEMGPYGQYNVTVTDGNGCSSTVTIDYQKNKLSSGEIAGISVIAAIIFVGTIAILVYYFKNRSKDKYSSI